MYILWKIVYIEYNCINSLANCIGRIYNSMIKCAHWMYKTLYIILKIMVVECIKLYTLFKKLCILNIQNHVHSLKKFVRGMERKKIYYTTIK